LSDETPGFGFFFSRFVLLLGLVINRNKFFNTTDGLGVYPVAVFGVRVATVELQIVRGRRTTWRGRPIVAGEAYVVQHAATVVTEPVSGKTQSLN
jgi:hypothetical protein